MVGAVAFLRAPAHRLRARRRRRRDDADSDASSGARWPASADDEMERLGRFLDAQRASELSQYWAVAGGALAVGAPQVALGGRS